MGGFAYGTSVKELEDALAMYDVKVADCKGISYRNYGWSFVKVENAQQAQKLVACSPIEIRGRTIDVRPFIDRKRVEGEDIQKILLLFSIFFFFLRVKKKSRNTLLHLMDNTKQRFKNHQQNRPSSHELLEAVLEAAHQTSGLTVAQMQTRLFRKFQFRVDGPEITKLVSKNPKLLQIKRHPIERIVLTPKMHRIPMKELKWKILKIFNSPDSTAKSGQENTSSDNEVDNKQKILSLTEFENEFARRYKAYLEPRLYGHRTVLELLQSMNDILCFPRAHSQSLVSQQHQPQESGLMLGPLLQANLAMAVTETEANWNNPKNFTMINTPIVSTTSSNAMNNNMFLGSMFMCPKINTLPTNQPMNFTGLPHIQVRTQSSLQQIPNTETPKPLPTLENSWSLQDTSVQQRQFLLPPFSNLSAFSNSPSGNQSPQTKKQTSIKPSVENTISTSVICLEMPKCVDIVLTFVVLVYMYSYGFYVFFLLFCFIYFFFSFYYKMKNYFVTLIPFFVCKGSVS
ncbi:hypothetical protein RFI_03423 [Reticulomyxa filosa]|uniref:HTH OST-type domain-containing protein n=1 Tax=Reticulomyxa filosa TaxID=46433 RepID=X6P7R2_RETFI|nr:hypothetical protein RFI_03423 [Reticulomyxa filosa]|eukprot:ETO33672.1 hypothetical protein RFI_03423 [Reticulomyxa filosa]